MSRTSRQSIVLVATSLAVAPLSLTVANAESKPDDTSWSYWATEVFGKALHDQIADTVARIIAPWLSERLGQQVIIENRPGASTNIAVQAVVNSPLDGYTLLFYGGSSIVNTYIFANLPFDIQRDIAPVCGVVAYPMILVAHPSVPAKTVAELIAQAKANPGKISMASFGTGEGYISKLMS